MLVGAGMALCCFGNNPPAPALTEKVNGDGVLNIFDLILLAKNFATTDYSIMDADWIRISNIKMLTCPNNLV